MPGRNRLVQTGQSAPGASGGFFAQAFRPMIIRVDGLLVAIGLLTLGTAMLVFNRRVARFWSGIYQRPVPTGVRYFYFYIAGPILLFAFGVLAVLSVLFKK